MSDLLMVLLIAAAFAGAGGYICACIQLTHPPE
jgi:hypothetical protein